MNNVREQIIGNVLLNSFSGYEGMFNNATDRIFSRVLFDE